MNLLRKTGIATLLWTSQLIQFQVIIKIVGYSVLASFVAVILSNSPKRRYKQMLSLCSIPRSDLIHSSVLGGAGIKRIHTLNNKRHVITKDSDGEVCLWDILKVII